MRPFPHDAMRRGRREREPRRGAPRGASREDPKIQSGVGFAGPRTSRPTHGTDVSGPNSMDAARRATSDNDDSRSEVPMPRVRPTTSNIPYAELCTWEIHACVTVQNGGWPGGPPVRTGGGILVNVCRRISGEALNLDSNFTAAAAVKGVGASLALSTGATRRKRQFTRPGYQCQCAT